MREIRFGFMAPGAIEEFPRIAEELGADAMAWGESPTQFTDPYVKISCGAAITKRLMFGTVMTCPGLRHPAVLANTFQELQRSSGGRVFCGIGTGDLALIEMGEQPFKLQSFVEYATAVRSLIVGKEVEWQGRPLKLLTEPVERVPVWFGADGPRGMKLAGALADGIIVGQAGGPQVVATVIDRMTEAASGANRNIAELDIWFMLRVILTDEEDGAIEIDGLDEYATRALRYLWRTAGKPERSEFAAALFARRALQLDEDTVDRLYEFNQRWDETNAFNSKVNVKLMDDLELRRFAARYFYISGPPEVISARVRDLIDAGARNFIVPFMGGDQVAAARQMAPVLNALR